MSIEKSVFDQDKMQAFLLREYGFHLDEMRHLPFGTANCYKISCREGTYFFKEYQSRFDLQDVKKETELVGFLDSKDFPVARFISMVRYIRIFKFEMPLRIRVWRTMRLPWARTSTLYWVIIATIPRTVAMLPLVIFQWMILWVRFGGIPPCLILD